MSIENIFFEKVSRGGPYLIFIDIYRITNLQYVQGAMLTKLKEERDKKRLGVNFLHTNPSSALNKSSIL
jgi:hypothetical protein